MASPRPRRFAPLRGTSNPSPFHSDPPLRGVVFDMDGTLWYDRPQHRFGLFERFGWSLASLHQRSSFFSSCLFPETLLLGKYCLMSSFPCGQK
ncbi:hypothetical protein V8C44DRAFT_316166 [Trichoderma aethiopicum]